MKLTLKSQTKSPASDRLINVLLVDDQSIVCESIRRMLATETDIELHFCQDPTKALEMARAVRPTVILQDLVMPDIDGLMLVKFFRVNPLTREIPMIVLSSKEEAVIKAQAFELGANDYLVKLPDKVELIARIRYHSRAYLTLLERNEASRLLRESQRLLAQEIQRAAEYVQSLLPAKLKTPVRTDWRFAPSTDLGGDMFGYHWLDPDHLAIYLLDVSGHGVGSSLMAVSAMNVLTGQSLPNTDFRDPVAVLKGLNQIFQMEKHNEKYFTLWYGVYRSASRELVFGNAGHPATLLFTGPSEAQVQRQELGSHGIAIGMVPEFDYESGVVKLDAYARLLIYSDGVFEIDLPQGGMWTFEEFVEYVSGLSPADGSIIDQLLAHVRALHGSETLGDDFSMVEIHF